MAALLATTGTSVAAADHEQAPTLVWLEVTFNARNGCRATVTEREREPPYRRSTGRAHRLPDEAGQLRNALRGLGSNRLAANVHGDAGVPPICSGYALEAVRVAGFQQIGFSLPPPPEADERLERVSACDVAADPARFRSQRIQVRGAVQQTMTPDGVHFHLIDLECRSGFELDAGQLELYRLFIDDLRHRVAVIVVTGSVAIRTCYLIPPGASCGLRFNVERFEHVERPDLCWTYERAGPNRFEPIAVPCPSPLMN